jgi:hypothetical protein
MGAHLLWRLGMWLRRHPAPVAPQLLEDFLRHSVFTRGGQP